MLTIKWGAPAVHADGKTPLDPADVVGYDLQMRVQGAPGFTSLSSTPITATTFDVDVTTPGTYEFQCLTITKASPLTLAGTSAPAVASYTIVAPVVQQLAAPPQNLTVTPA